MKCKGMFLINLLAFFSLNVLAIGDVSVSFIDEDGQRQGEMINAEVDFGEAEVQPAGNARAEKLKRQKEVWGKLDRNARKVIIERAKYVYRFSDDIIVDAYEMMYWQSELSSNIVVEKKYKVTERVGILQKETTSEKRVYREDEKLQAYFSIPTYPCLVWYKGVLVNDSQRWDENEYKELRVDMGADGLKSTQMRTALREEARRKLPCIVVIDPIASRDFGSNVYRGGSLSGLVKLGYGIWGRFESTQGVFARSSTNAISQNNPGFYLVPDKKLQDGKPSLTLTSYALLPSSPQGASQSAFGGGSRVDTPVRYEVHELKRYKMNPKELAVAFIDGEVEIPYRTGTRAGGIWLYEEQLLLRP